MKKNLLIFLVVAGFFSNMVTADLVVAAGQTLKIATVRIQEVLAKSKVGLEAQKNLQAKANELQKNLQSDQEELAQLQNQIEMKSSVWSQDVREEKERDYQRKMRSLQMRSEDAKYEMKQLEKKFMDPILKNLNDVLAEVGADQGYSLVLADEGRGLASRVGLLYASPELDITESVIKKLDAKSK